MKKYWFKISLLFLFGIWACHPAQEEKQEDETTPEPFEIPEGFELLKNIEMIPFCLPFPEKVFKRDFSKPYPKGKHVLLSSDGNINLIFEGTFIDVPFDNLFEKYLDDLSEITADKLRAEEFSKNQFKLSWEKDGSIIWLKKWRVDDNEVVTARIEYSKAKDKRVNELIALLSKLDFPSCEYIIENKIPEVVMTPKEELAEFKNKYESKWKEKPQAFPSKEASIIKIYELDCEGDCDRAEFTHRVSKGENIDAEELNDFLDILKNPDSYSESGAACYSPKFGIVLYDAEGVPFDFMSLCLDCNNYQTYPDNIDVEIKDETKYALSRDARRKLRNILEIKWSGRNLTTSFFSLAI